jgi:iron complex outermembrane receptor protein
MKKHAHLSLAKALCPSLVLALGSQFIGTPQAVAQGDTNEVKRVTITGSAIPTAETVGAAPVTVVGVADIQRSGATDVLSILKKVDTSFSGNGNVGETVNNGGQGEANVALRNLQTLVLIDGRRLASSGFSNGQQVDLNTIPASMIDHIEILKDGASTIYGSDAIGGVVNIITKKDLNGAILTGRVGFPMDKSSNDLLERRASLVAGVSDDKSSFVVGADYYNRDPLLTKDRFVSSAGIADLAARGILPPSYVSPTYPGRVDNFILAGSPFAQGAAGYNAATTFPGYNTGVPYATIAAFNAAHPGIYLGLAGTPQGAAAAAVGFALINTTQFGTISVQSQDRKQFFGHGEHDLIGKQLEVYADVMYTSTRSEAALAPSPVSFLAINALTVPANNPYNVFDRALGAAGSGVPRIRQRLIDSGNRNFDSNKDFYRIVAGVKGYFEETTIGYDSGFSYSRSSDTQYIRNAVSGAALNLALTPDTTLANPAGLPAGFPANSYFSLLKDSAGNAVPVYNPFALPGANATAATLNAIRATLFDHAATDLMSWDGRIYGDIPWKLPGGAVSAAIGGDWRVESLEVITDDLYNRNLAVGLNAIPTLSRRFVSEGAGYMEVRVPVFSPDWNVPGAYSLELNASGRVAEFEPSGEVKGIPKFGFLWHPIDNDLAVRGTWSQGFITPPIFFLFGPTGTSNPTVSGNGSSGQVNVNIVSNPALPNAKSETWTGGVVWSPSKPSFLKGLTVSVDYYRILETGLSTLDSAQNALNSLNALGSGSPYAPGFTFASGAPITTPAPNQVNSLNWGSANITYVPGNAQLTDGIDIGASYLYDADAFGKFTFGCNANILLNYLFRTPGNPYNQFAGLYTDAAQGPVGAEGSLPGFTIKPYLLWEWRDLTVFANAKYIPGITSQGNLFPTIATGTQGFTANGLAWQVPDYYTIDLQVSYELGKTKADKAWYDGTKLTIGIDNLTDNIAPLIAGAFEDNTDKTTYSIWGRFVYLEISKKF